VLVFEAVGLLLVERPTKEETAYRPLARQPARPRRCRQAAPPCPDRLPRGRQGGRQARRVGATTLGALRRRGLVASSLFGGDGWTITDAGREALREQPQPSREQTMTEA
jgi:hypothetical protein